MSSLLDVLQGFGVLRNPAQQRTENVRKAMSNYMADPQGTIAAVNQIDAPSAIALKKQYDDQTQADQKQHIDNLQQAFGSLRTVRDNGGDVGAAVDQVGHLFNLKPEDLSTLKSQLTSNPHYIDMLDAEAQKASSKIENVPQGGGLFQHGKEIYHNAAPAKGVVVPAGGDYLPPGVGGVPGPTPTTPGPIGSVAPVATPAGADFFNKHIVGAGEHSDGGPGAPFMVSPKGAIGPAQLMPGTIPEAAKLAGVDPALVRKDRNANLAAGNAYYNKQLSDFGDPILAAAAYNAGGGRLKMALRLQQSKGGNWTQYVPPETQKYVQRVAASMAGVAAPAAPAAAATPAVSGWQPNGVYHNAKAPGAGGATLEPDTVKFYADQILAGGKMPSTGMGGAAMRAQIMNAVVQQAKVRGLSAPDLLANAADSASLTSSLSNQQKIFGQISAAEKTAIANGELFLNIAKSAPGQTQYPIANKLIQMYGGHTGNTQVRAMNAAAEVFAQEYGKVMSGNANGAAALTVSAAEHARSVISQADTPQAKYAVMQTLKADMANRLKGFVSTQNATRQAIRKVGSAPTPQRTIKAAGKLVKAKDGSYTWSPQ